MLSLQSNLKQKQNEINIERTNQNRFSIEKRHCKQRAHCKINQKIKIRSRESTPLKFNDFRERSHGITNCKNRVQ